MTQEKKPITPNPIDSSGGIKFFFIGNKHTATFLVKKKNTYFSFYSVLKKKNKMTWWIGLFH
jgi:hypothetical protein